VDFRDGNYPALACTILGRQALAWAEGVYDFQRLWPVIKLPVELSRSLIWVQRDLWMTRLELINHHSSLLIVEAFVSLAPDQMTWFKVLLIGKLMFCNRLLNHRPFEGQLLLEHFGSDHKPEASLDRRKVPHRRGVKLA